MISLQNGVSRAPLVSDRAGEAGYAAVKQEPASSLSLVSSFKGPDSHEGLNFLVLFFKIVFEIFRVLHRLDIYLYLFVPHIGVYVNLISQ